MCFSLAVLIPLPLCSLAHPTDVAGFTPLLTLTGCHDLPLNSKQLTARKSTGKPNVMELARRAAAAAASRNRRKQGTPRRNDQARRVPGIANRRTPSKTVALRY